MRVALAAVAVTAAAIAKTEMCSIFRELICPLITNDQIGDLAKREFNLAYQHFYVSQSIDSLFHVPQALAVVTDCRTFEDSELLELQVIAGAQKNREPSDAARSIKDR
jgi:hypothetical protein